MTTHRARTARTHAAHLLKLAASLSRSRGASLKLMEGTLCVVDINPLPFPPLSYSLLSAIKVLVVIHYSVLDARIGYIRNVVV